MKRILFPTDFSKVSLNAFAYALELADTLDAEILSLHVYQLPVMDYDGVPPYLLETYNVFELGNFENFKDQVPILRTIAEQRGKDHVRISNALLEGDLVFNILETIKKENIDLVVMGTKGASGLEEVFLGTVTAKVMTSTDALVLAVPEESEFRPIRKIGFTTTFSDADRTALHHVIDIARALGAEVECFYVRTADSKVTEVRIADWELVFKGKARFSIVERDDVEQAIADFTEVYHIDVLALLNHRHGFFEGLFHHSRAKKLAYHTKVPLLALH